MPKFRRFGGYSAYGEGWGLYAERLGKEMGFYREPMSEFGMLSTQLWRAIRLVVDTGIHTMRWTREQAIDYFLDNGLLSRARRDQGGRALFQQSRPGDQLHDRPAEDPRAARPRPRRARATASTSATSTPWCWRMARCRSTCSRSWSTPGSPNRRNCMMADDTPPDRLSNNPRSPHFDMERAAARRRHPLQGPRARRRRGILRLRRLDPGRRPARRSTATACR